MTKKYFRAQILGKYYRESWYWMTHPHCDITYHFIALKIETLLSTLMTESHQTYSSCILFKSPNDGIISKRIVLAVFTIFNFKEVNCGIKSVDFK